MPILLVIWAKNKKLHSFGKILSFFISGDTIKIMVNENSSLLSLTHIEDFGKNFPDVDLSPPDHMCWAYDAVIPFYTCILIDLQGDFK